MLVKYKYLCNEEPNTNIGIIIEPVVTTITTYLLWNPKTIQLWCTAKNKDDFIVIIYIVYLCMMANKTDKRCEQRKQNRPQNKAAHHTHKTFSIDSLKPVFCSCTNHKNKIDQDY